MSECECACRYLDHSEVLTQAEVLKIVRLSRPQVWALRKRGQFPAPINYPTTGSGTRPRLRWLRRDIDAWLTTRKPQPVAATALPFAELHFLGSPRGSISSFDGGAA